MREFNLRVFKIKFNQLKPLQILCLSLLVCILFYIIEGLLGISRLYHPDSTHYLTNKEMLKIETLINNPILIEL